LYQLKVSKRLEGNPFSLAGHGQSPAAGLPNALTLDRLFIPDCSSCIVHPPPLFIGGYHTASTSSTQPSILLTNSRIPSLAITTVPGELLQHDGPFPAIYCSSGLGH
jgi:hypothetical protein